MPTIFERSKLGPFTKEEDLEREDILKAAGSLMSTLAIPAATILPFQDYLNDTNKIKEQEAMRMFPQADPSIFKGAAGRRVVNLIPESQKVAQARLYNIERFNNAPNLVRDDIYKLNKIYPGFLPEQPDAPSAELGGFQTLLQNKPASSEGSLQAITVTPGPGPSRFSSASLENVDKLGATLNQIQYERNKPLWNQMDGPEVLNQLHKQVETLEQEYVPQGGHIWGNITKPQYDYAQRSNPQTGAFIQTVNPSLYLSRFDASPFKQADYLYTSNLDVEPRVKLKMFEDEGRTTGPSWGVRGESSSSGLADADVNFRRDLIEARGELTTGDIQALLKSKGLPFEYQSTKGTKLTKDSSKILATNLNRLAESEGLTPYQSIEKYARAVPALGDPTTPPTLAVAGRVSEFPVEGPGLSPFGRFASKTDLRQIGILPPSDKANYKAFNVDEFDQLFKYVYPRYDASNIQPVGTYTTSVNPLEPFGKTKEGLDELIINRDKLRPMAANKLLKRTVNNLVEQSKPIKSLGLGGLATGGIATTMDPAVIDALSRGDYMQAGTTAAINTAIGSTVGGATAKGLQALTAAGYARPAAAIASSLPLATGVLGGLGLAETGKALNRAYKERTGKDWADRNKPKDYDLYTGATPTIQPRTGTAILGGKPVQVPYGSIAGQKTVGRPWWDKAGSQIEKFANLLNSGSIIGR
jgi:hypothetical protein